jgi:tRNA nucleotidyltransferase (CCA-adding enzyme)
MKRSLWSYITEWRLVEPVTSGNDLRKRDISPGPNYKRILDTLRAAWLDGEVTSSKEEIILLEKLLSE